MIPLSQLQIDDLEQRLGIKLPGLYRKILVIEGYGTRGEFEIYHPTEIREHYQYHFDNPEDLFEKWFPFGCNNGTQEIWIIDPATETAAAISHETNPDDYGDEEWLDYAEWGIRFLPADFS